MSLLNAVPLAKLSLTPNHSNSYLAPVMLFTDLSSVTICHCLCAHSVFVSHSSSPSSHSFLTLQILCVYIMTSGLVFSYGILVCDKLCICFSHGFPVHIWPVSTR